MNERIKELAEQAWDFLIVEMGGDTESTEFLHAYDQKFAELIVRECLDICKDVNRNPYLEDEYQARQIIKNIEKHFGVE